MGKRYEIGAYDVVAGTQSVVEIHDSEFAGTAETMKGHAQGGSPIVYTKQSLNPRTRQDNPILKTELQIDIQIETAAHEQLLADIIGSDEDRFTFIYTIDGVEEWRGKVLPDLTTWPEDAAPYLHVQLFAKDFTNLGAVSYPDEDLSETIITTIAECLAQTGITNDIVTYTSWTEDNITSTEDFLNQIYHRTRQLIDLNKNEDETLRIRITYEEALTRILRNYGLICTQAGGQWHIWQESAFETPTSVVVSTYNSSGVLQSTATSDISHAPTSITLASQNEVTPGLKAVQNQFSHRSQTFIPRLPDFVSLGESGTETFSFNLTYTGDEIIKITSRVTATNSATAAGGQFRVQVKTGQYHWNGSAWVTGTASPVTFSMLGGGLQNSDGDYVYAGALSITTESIPSDATSPLEIIFYGATVNTDPVTSADSTLFDSLVFDITNLAIGDANSESILFNLTQSGNYSETYSHPQTFFGDGPTVISASALQFSSTAGDTTINSWSRRDIVGSRGFHANLLHELLDTNRKGRQLLSASIRDGYTFALIIEHRSDYFLNIGGSYDPYNSSWSPLLLKNSVLDATDSLTNRIGDKVTVITDSSGDMVILQDGVIKSQQTQLGQNSQSILLLQGTTGDNATAISALESSVAKVQNDSAAVMRSTTEPTTRPSGDPLEEGDIWIDSSNNVDGFPKDTAYVWDGDSWEPYDGELKLSVAGVRNTVTQYEAQSLIYAKTGGGLAYINVSSSETAGTDITISGEHLHVSADTTFDGDVNIKGTLTATNWTGGSISDAEGINLIFSDNSPAGVGTEISFNGLDDINGMTLGRIYADADDGVSIQSDLQGISLRANSGSINLSIGSVNGIINLGSETHYQGQELDARFGVSANDWSSLSGKPFTSLSTSEFDVVSGELRIDEIAISKITNLQTELASKADTGDIPTNFDDYGGWDLETNGTIRTTVGSGQNVNFEEGSDIDVSYGTGTVTIAHANTSSQGSINNSGTTVIQDISVDGNGHVTDINSKALDRGDFSLDTNDNVQFNRVGIGTAASSTYPFRVALSGDDFFINANGNVQVGGNAYANDFILG